MAISTVDSQNNPRSRYVLFKNIVNDSLVFHSHYESAKAKEIENNPNVSGLFFWPEIYRQIRFEGVVSKASAEVSDEYFKSINKEKLNAEIITPVFKEFKNDSYKVIAIYAKKARGLMSRFLIERKSKNVDDIKLFNTDGYTFDGNLSTENELVFTR